MPVSYTILADWLVHPPGVEQYVSDFPDDARLLFVEPDQRQQVLRCYFASASFAEVPDGAAIPERSCHWTLTETARTKDARAVGALWKWVARGGYGTTVRSVP